jgi:hypothetical protein
MYAPTATPKQRRALDRLAREHSGRGRIIITPSAGQTFRVLLVDARGGLAITHTITRGGFVA